MKVLITGGTGSLGSALVRRYLLAGAEKIVVYSRDEVKQGDLTEVLKTNVLGTQREVMDIFPRCQRCHHDLTAHTRTTDDHVDACSLCDCRYFAR